MNSAENNFNLVWTEATSDADWNTLICFGARSVNDDSTGFTPLKVGDTISYEAGYRSWDNAADQTVTHGSTKPTSLLTYTLVDQASAVALGVSLAALAASVNSLSY